MWVRVGPGSRLCWGGGGQAGVFAHVCLVVNVCARSRGSYGDSPAGTGVFSWTLT